MHFFKLLFVCLLVITLVGCSNRSLELPTKESLSFTELKESDEYNFNAKIRKATSKVTVGDAIVRKEDSFSRTFLTIDLSSIESDWLVGVKLIATVDGDLELEKSINIFNTNKKYRFSVETGTNYDMIELKFSSSGSWGSEIFVSTDDEFLETGNNTVTVSPITNKRSSTVNLEVVNGTIVRVNISSTEIVNGTYHFCGMGEDSVLDTFSIKLKNGEGSATVLTSSDKEGIKIIGVDVINGS